MILFDFDVEVHWGITEFYSEFSCGIASISSIHKYILSLLRWTKSAPKFMSLWCITPLTGSQEKLDGIPIICGNQMKFGIPSTSTFSDRLFSVFSVLPNHQDAL